MPSPEELATYVKVVGTDGDDNNGAFKGANNVHNWLVGLAGHDQINGGNLADLIEGGDGNDNLHGNNGDDVLLGGAGNDTIQGNNDNDCIDGGDGDDKIEGGNGNDNLHGAAGHDTLYGDNGDDRIDGGGGNDTIYGGQGNDLIHGGDGSDHIDGGPGDDQITGGKGDDLINVADGNDTVYYTSALDGFDVIDKFDGNAKGGQDILDLDKLFDSLESTLGPLDAATRAGMVQVVDKGTTVDVSIDMDHNPATGPVHIAMLNTNDVITVGEDIVVNVP
jgi:Ca2+-binding RTX toxin-like protein